MGCPYFAFPKFPTSGGSEFRDSHQTAVTTNKLAYSRLNSGFELGKVTNRCLAFRASLKRHMLNAPNAPVQRRAAQRTVRCNRLILIKASPGSISIGYAPGSIQFP
jgi:hypothetical protein